VPFRGTHDSYLVSFTAFAQDIVAVPFRGTHDSYTVIVTNTDTLNVAVPFRGTHDSYFVTALSSEEVIHELITLVAVPFRGTHDSYSFRPQSVRAVWLSQCPFAARMTPTYGGSLADAVMPDMKVAVPFRGTHDSYCSSSIT
jgi:hypothetical protein